MNECAHTGSHEHMLFTLVHSHMSVCTLLPLHHTLLSPVPGESILVTVMRILKVLRRCVPVRRNV